MGTPVGNPNAVRSANPLGIAAQARALPRLSDRKTEVIAALIAARLRTTCSENRLLVVGCGSGLEAAILAQCLHVSVTGIDLSEHFDPRAQALAQLQIGDALALQFADDSFDFVYSYHALEHVSDPRRALREMQRVLRPGGHFCIGTPNRLRWIGYLGSKRASWKQKLAWNLADWNARLQGRFRNEYGAHAGFSRGELGAMLRETFAQVEDMTEVYYAALYRQHAQVIAALERTGASHAVFPSVYFFGTNGDRH
jgi:SAM-dependent methyltransferase